MAEARLAAPALNFSTNGQLLALSCADGTLKVWDTGTGSLNQEYVPSSHLSATCTCLAWCPKSLVLDSRSPNAKKKKKRKSDAGQNLELVAMGTMAGNVLLYSVTKGDLHTQLSEGHTGRVNAVCWSRKGESLFSCSDDGHVTEWQLSKASPKHKWKADDNPVHAVSVFGDDDQMLTASREIKLWNLKEREVIKTFTGHASVVQWLTPIGLGDRLSSYFLSATMEDRHISIWQATSSSTKTALALLSLEEEPIYMDTWAPSSEGQPFMLLVVTKSGKLQIFEHTLNGRLKKPIKPKFAVQIASQAQSTNSKPSQIPILTACVKDDNEKEILLAFGTSLKPVFEKLPFSDLKTDTIIVREDPRLSHVNHMNSVSKLKVTEVPSDVTVLAPGHTAPLAPAMATGGEAKSKMKRKERKSADLTMEERLNALGMDKPDSKSKQQSLPRTDTLCTLLTQGLQSQDKKILNHVLQTSDKKLVTNTVKKLPMPVIIPLVQELTKRMQGHAQSGRQLIVWVRSILTTHTSYLMTFPELIESFSSLYQMMESRVKTYGQLSRLQGKLNLMISQVGSQAQEEEETVTVQQPLLAYQDESSDEQEMEFDAESESEADWDGSSDMDTAPNGLDEEDDDDDDEEDDDEDDDDDV